MADNVNIIVQDTINDIVVNAAQIVETIDINVQAAVDVVDIVANPNNYVVNINRIIGEQVQSDWTQNDNQAPDYIKNKPTIPTNTSDLVNDGENGVDPFITAADIPPVTGFVPYTGATEDVNLGEFELKAGQLTLDTTPTGTAAVATTQWNDTAGVSQTTLKGGTVALKNGVDLVARVVNKVTPNATLLRANYTAVRISGAQGQRLAVAYAQANNDNNSADTIGLVCENIATNQEGFIMTMGQFEEINTTGSLQGETWADGDVLYLSPTTAGRLTNIKPTGLTGHIVVMGYVEYAHAIHGKIYVKIMNGWELDELHNVYINQATLANNDGLFYDSSDQLWKNETIASALGYTPFQLPSLTSGSVLFSNGTTIEQDNANLFWDDTNNRLGIGTATPATTFQVLGTSTTQNIAAQTNATYDIGLLATRFRDGWFSRNLNCSTIWSNNLAIATTNLTLYNAAVSVIGTLFGSGNLLLSTGTQTDAGFKLDVNGTARVSGTTTITPAALTGTAATSALDIAQTWNTTGTPSAIKLNVTDTASNASSLLMQLQIGGSNRFRVSKTGTATASNSFSAPQFSSAINTSGNISIYESSGSVTASSSSTIIYSSLLSFAPTSGTGTFIGFNFTGTINQTGGANGITRGLYINPTLTSAADFRAIENSVGKVCLNTTSGNTMIGTTTDAGFKLDVNGTARVSGNTTINGFVFNNGLFSNSGILNIYHRQDISVGVGLITNSATTSVSRTTFVINDNFAPTSGTNTYSNILLQPIINQTGTATGITRGLYIAPTLTAAADWRAIEVANGITILGASTTAKASLRIPSGTAPTTPTNGDIWFDGTNLKMQIGGVTKTFTLI